MSEEITCLECGRPIRAGTARRIKGLCISCRTKRSTSNPFSILFASLIERVHDSSGGFNALSEPEKLYYATALMRNEVHNGGFHQYFFNSSGSYYEYAQRGLTELAATQTLALLRQAKQVVFPTMLVPTDTERRRNLLPFADPDAPVPEWSKKLDELDQRLYTDPDGLNARLERFARQNALVSAKDEQVT
jgi:hypothetical protein